MKNLFLVLGVILLVPGPLRAEDDTAPARAAVERMGELEGMDVKALVERVEDVLRGDTIEMSATMTITTPRWTRAVRFRSHDDRLGDRSLIRILAPKKDRGTGFLRVDRTFWTYLPRVERTMRIPPSMMLQSWMGSDFTNDDLARESSLTDDYVPRYVGIREIDGVAAYGVELDAKPDAPVVWARVEIWVEKERLAPIVEYFYDEGDPDGYERVRTLVFSDVREIDGRPLPHHWAVIPEDKPGHRTEVEIESAAFDRKMDDQLFTQKNLRRAEGAR